MLEEEEELIVLVVDFELEEELESVVVVDE